MISTSPSRGESAARDRRSAGGHQPVVSVVLSDCAKSAQADAKGRFRIAGVDDKLVFNVLVAAHGYRRHMHAEPIRGKARSR